MRSTRGFGLIELMVALALGLIVVLGVAQIFISAKNTYVSQNASASMQEDARFVLSKMLQEIRMVGMFGCLESKSIIDASLASDFAANSAKPIAWDNANLKLTLVTADVGNNGGSPTWTVISSDCRSDATAYTGAHAAPSGQLAFPVRRLTYTLRNNQLWMNTGTGNDAGQVLVNNVSAFGVTFGVANSDSGIAASSYSSNPSVPARIRSVRLTLTLTDPNNRVRNQTYNVVAALRNRLL
jgi:type IV pilus assembly protein PilW